MYHIKNDKRCERSAGIIVDALACLLAKKPFPEITVTDIQRTAGIGRSTFYRHFDNIDDVVEYFVDMSFRETVRNYEELPPHEFTLACLSTVIEKGEMMMKILDAGRSAIITRSLRKNLVNMNYPRSAEAAAEYSFAVFAASCISIIKSWDENGRKESIEELAGYLERYLDYQELNSVHGH